MPHAQGCIRRGGGGGAGTPLLPASPYGPRRRQAKKFSSLNPLGIEGAEAQFWLSASNIGRGGGGGLVGGGGYPPLLLRCTALLVHHCPCPPPTPLHAYKRMLNARHPPHRTHTRDLHSGGTNRMPLTCSSRRQGTRNPHTRPGPKGGYVQHMSWTCPRGHPDIEELSWTGWSLMKKKKGKKKKCSCTQVSHGHTMCWRLATGD